MTNPMTDWQVCDFYRYNPPNGTGYMCYSEYLKGRLNGTIPIPDPDEVRRDIMHPIHVKIDEV